MSSRSHFLLYLVLCWIGTTPVPATEPDVTRPSLSAALLSKVLASAVFVSGRDPAAALQESVYPLMAISGFNSDDIRRLEVDRQNQEVRMSINDGPLRTARYFGDQGCIIIPLGENDVFFKPTNVTSKLPPAETLTWPMGDLIDVEQRPQGIDEVKLAAGVDKMFQPEAHTAALVVLYRGQIIAERYAAGADQTTPLESWSMGKTLTAVLYGLTAHRDGVWDPQRAASFPEWQSDDRRDITVGHLLRMSSGLRFSSRDDPSQTWNQGHPDHTFVYSGAINVFDFSLTRPLEHSPGTIGRYRNCDPLLVGLMVRRWVEGRDGVYLTFPQRELFDRLGMRNMVLETDPHGNFLLTGYDYGSARDWARLGQLLLQDGVWMGERILPEGFVEFLTTPAPAWKRSEYGGLTWLGSDWSGWYRASGQGGQKVNVVPKHDLVVVRLGHQAGMRSSGAAFDEAMPLIIEALPKAN